MEIRRRADHYHHARPWLEAEWHFSFGEYRDPDNQGFGPLRVLNNDRVEGGGGWGMHSHTDMEIITWVVAGLLEHEDSTGSVRTLGRGGLQRMSAGTGISHSERNASGRDPLHLLQIWIEPDRPGRRPEYEERVFGDEQLSAGWTSVASGRGEGGATLHQDVTLRASRPRAGTTLEGDPAPGRRGYLVVVGGTFEGPTSTLSEGDAVRLHGPEELTLVARADGELLFVDLPGGSS